jgi:serine/threonine protein kinase
LGAVLYLALTGQSPFPARTGETADGVVLRVLREPPPEVSGRDVPPALSGLLQRMMAKEPDARPDAVTVLREFEELLSAAPVEDELDFDDFSDELAAGRNVPVATITAKPVVQKKKRKQRKPRKGLLIGAAAAVALVAVVPVMIQPGADDETAPPAPATSITQSTTPSPTASAQAAIVLKPPQDKGTSVVLSWSFPKELTYAVLVAEQGAKTPRVTSNGKTTTATVQISPGLKYCFQIQGTDGVTLYQSAPRSLRGATCVGGQ